MDNAMELREAMESVYGPAEALIEKWAKYADVIKEVAKDEGREVSDITLMTTAMMLENLDHYHSRMDESTMAVNVGSFIHHGFDLIAAVMPSLIANEIVSVQPQTRKIGEIFYLEFLYGSNKGRVSKGDTMFGWQVAGNAETTYTSDEVTQETVVASAPGGEDQFSGTLAWPPILAGSASFTDGVETFTDNGDNTLTGSAGGTGTINYSNGNWTLDFNADVTIGTAILSTYRTDFEANPEAIPEVNLHIQSIPVIARPRKLRARYTLDAAFDVNAAFGRSVGAELDVALASEIRQEIDGELLAALLAGYGAGSYDWSRTPPDPQISYAEHKWTFLDALVAVKNLIFAATRRATGNFMVAGIGVCNVIEGLAPRFKPTGKIQPGPHLLGTLDGMPVYKNPYYPADEALVGYKGTMFMESGLVYAPYMPLYTTQPIMLDDFVTRKGMATMYAKKMVNPKFYARFRVTS